MKRTYLLLLISFFLNSCKKDISCSGDTEKENLFKSVSSDFEIIYDRIKQDVATGEIKGITVGLPFDEVKDNFFENYVTLKKARPTKIEEDLKRCECEAELFIKLPSDLFDYFKANPLNYKYDFLFPIFHQLRKEEFSKQLIYSIQETEDDEMFVKTEGDFYDIEKAFFLYSIFVNYENAPISDNNKTEFKNGLDWLDFIFKCAHESNKYCYPSEKEVCTERFIEYTIEVGSIYGPSSYSLEESIAAEKEYIKKWSKIYKEIHKGDEAWLFGRGNGVEEGDPLKSVNIRKINDFNFEIIIDFGGYKTKNSVLLVKERGRYLIDFCKTDFI